MGGKNMNKVRIETSFEIDSRLDADEVFKALADSLFDADSSSSNLQDADVFAKSHEFTLAIVGIGETIDSAVLAATDAIRTAIEASGVKALTFA
jgi:hypothetical protein